MRSFKQNCPDSYLLCLDRHSRVLSPPPTPSFLAADFRPLPPLLTPTRSLIFHCVFYLSRVDMRCNIIYVRIHTIYYRYQTRFYSISNRKLTTFIWGFVPFTPCK